MPITKTDPASAWSAEFLSTGFFLGGEKAIIKNENITATKTRGKNDMPKIVGPKGVTQSCSAQLTRKIIKKKIKIARHGPLPDKAININVSKSETRKAEGMI